MGGETTSITRYRRRVRRGFAVVALAALAAGTAACGGGDGSGATADLPSSRTVDTEMGPVEIPTQPDRILALDEYAALNLMALGIEPTTVWGSYQSEVGGRLITDAGIPLESSSVTGEIDIEAVAAERPDIIVVTSEGAFIDNYPTLADVAPTIVLPYAKPWRDVISETARIFDRRAEGAALIAALENQIDEVSVADDAPSISLLGNTYGMLFAASSVSPLSNLVDEVGYTRPRAQAEGKTDPTYDGAIVLSEEVVGDHDADVVVVFQGADHDADAVTGLPTFRSLPATVDGRTVVVDGDMWFGTYPFAIYWILEDLAAIQDGDMPGGLGTVADTESRWAAFRKLL